MKKTFCIIAVLLVFVICRTVSEACVYVNDWEEVFTKPAKVAIGDEVVMGSADFFQSYSAAMLVLYEREIAEKDFFDVEKSLNHAETAIAKLESARDRYNKALNLALATDYAQDRIDQLKSFDYGKFSSANTLNPSIMQEAKKYLEKGDIIGLYRKNIENVTAILAHLYKIRESLKGGLRPDLSLYSDLIRTYSTTVLLGNYSTSCGQKVFTD